MYQLWHKLDGAGGEFGLPKVVIVMQIKSPLCFTTARDVVLAELFTSLVEDALSEFAYDADVASLRYGLSSGIEGLSLQMWGYNHKLSILLLKILETLTTLKVDPTAFNSQRQKLEQYYINFMLGDPYRIVMDKTNRTMQDKSFQFSEYQAIAAEVTVEELTAWIPRMLEKAFFKAYVHGNMAPEGAIEVMDQVVESLKMAPLSAEELSSVKRFRLKLPEAPCEFRDQYVLTNSEETNSCIQISFEMGRLGLKEIALAKLFALALQNPCFEELRTKQQLGYIVFSGARMKHHTWSFVCLVQGATTPPEEVYTRIIEFLDSYRANQLQGMEPEGLQVVKEGLITKLLEKDQSLEAECMRHWGNIQEECPLAINMMMATLLLEITKEDLLQFFDAFLAAGARRAFVAAAHGSGHPWNGPPESSENVTYVPDLAVFKAGLEQYENDFKADEASLRASSSVEGFVRVSVEDFLKASRSSS